MFLITKSITLPLPSPTMELDCVDLESVSLSLYRSSRDSSFENDPALSISDNNIRSHLSPTIPSTEYTNQNELNHVHVHSRNEYTHSHQSTIDTECTPNVNHNFYPNTRRGSNMHYPSQHQNGTMYDILYNQHQHQLQLQQQNTQITQLQHEYRNLHQQHINNQQYQMLQTQLTAQQQLLILQQQRLSFQQEQHQMHRRQDQQCYQDLLGTLNLYHTSEFQLPFNNVGLHQRQFHYSDEHQPEPHQPSPQRPRITKRKRCQTGNSERHRPELNQQQQHHHQSQYQY